MNIGIVSRWFERGIAFISLAMRDALAKRHEVYVLTKPDPAPVGDEFDVPNLTRGSVAAYSFPQKWAHERELDVLVFNERLDCKRLAPLRGEFKTLCLLEWEFVPPDAADAINRCYDAIIAPTRAAARRFREIGIERVHHVRWGTDLVKFRPGRWGRSLQESQESNESVKFFQPANFGGMHGRKNVKATRQAWARADKKGATLMFALQRPGPQESGQTSTVRGTLAQEELAGLYRQADVALLPSMWEGLGLAFIEALASGLAIVTVDAPPMNSYVWEGWNGYACKAAMRDPPHGIHVPRAVVDTDDYAAAIERLARNPRLARWMGRNSRKLAEALYDWDRNGERLVEVVEEVVND